MSATATYTDAARFRGLAALPTPPTGWPIGSYPTYAQAQHAVDHLADSKFPVGDLTIFGVAPMIVERVTSRLTWARVLAAGAASGAWLGLFTGLLLTLLTTTNPLTTMLTGLAVGMLFSMVFAATGYASLRGRRDFTSTTQLVAGHYDVLCTPRNAEHGKQLLTDLATRTTTP